MFKQNLLFQNIVKYLCWLVVILISVFCSYHIIHNAQWVIGDDAIVIREIGFGGYASPSTCIRPTEGRFYPTTYLGYNLLVLLTNGHITPTSLYVYHTFYFLLMVVTGMLFFLMIQPLTSKWRYPIAAAATLLLISRYYSTFANCFGSGWFWTGISFFSLIMLVYFIKTDKLGYGITYLLLSIFTTYCSEKAFVTPLVIGILGLWLMKDANTRNRKILFWGLIINAVIFLSIYLGYIYPQISTAYDGAHGSGVTMFGNAIHIIIAQKLLWIGIPLLLWRLWEIFVNKKECTIFDVLLLSAAASTCGGFILRLNWVSYYNSAAITCLFCAIYFGYEYLSEKKQWIIFAVVLAFSLFYARKLPRNIQDVDRDRTDAKEFVDAILAEDIVANNIYFYKPGDGGTSFDETQRVWLYSALETYLAYELRTKDFKIQRKTEFTAEQGLWITIAQNDVIDVLGNQPIEIDCEHLKTNQMRKMDAWIKR